MCNNPCFMCGDYEDCMLRKRREDLEKDMLDIYQYQIYPEYEENLLAIPSEVFDEIEDDRDVCEE